MADAVGKEQANEELLHFARTGLVDKLRSVIEEGKADLDHQDVNGNTGLIFSAYNARVECLKLLVAANANVNVQNANGNTCLHGASIKGRMECLKLLLAANADVNVQDVIGCTGLMRASMFGQVECLELLLAANADINAQDQFGVTSLMEASHKGAVECLKLLLESNAEVNSRDMSNAAALAMCCNDYRASDTCQSVMQFLLLCCGAEGEEGKESLAAMNTRITEYHTDLKKVLSDEVVVDTRFHLEDNGLYHESLERVMQYCGLELMLENDPNREDDDPIPILLRARPERVRSGWYWWRQFCCVRVDS